MNQICRGRFYLSAIVFDLWRFFLPEFRIAGVRSKNRTFQIVAHKLKWLRLFESRMLAASVECLFNNLLSSICLLRFFKHNKLKMSKTRFFFKWHPVNENLIKFEDYQVDN
jgi:hypothetical protein